MFIYLICGLDSKWHFEAGSEACVSHISRFLNAPRELPTTNSDILKNK